MMSGGHYGEASLSVKYYRWDPNPDANNPYNAYIAEMARVKGESVNEIAAPYNGYISKFDYYFIENSKRIVDMYAQTFKNKAIVIQSGSGLSGDGEKVAGEVIDYAINTYGKRIWLKQNGWGNWVSGYGNGQDDWYYTLFGRYKNRSRVTREVGHLENMCFQPYDVYGNLNGNPQANPPYVCPNARDTRCCKRTDSAEALDYNTKLVNGVMGAGTSALCFQSNFFQTYSANIFPGTANQFPSIKNRLEENYRNYYLPAPDYTPTPTPVCPGLNGPATIQKFNTWKTQILNQPPPSPRPAADFNCDTKVNLSDFEIWRFSFVNP